MEKSRFADWLEKKYLSWQIENGRASIRQFSEWLDINQALVTQWMNDKAKPGPKTIHLLASKLGDEVYEILEDPAGTQKIPGLAEWIRTYILATPEQREKMLRSVQKTGTSSDPAANPSNSK